MSTARQQIITQVIADLTPLLTAGTIRGLSSGRFPANLDNKPSPWVHILHPDEQVVDQTLGHGYTIEFDLHIAIAIQNFKNGETTLEGLVTSIATAIETDSQLGGLATHCWYTGQVWFTSEELNGPAGCQLTYKVQYRRPYGDMTTTF
jgi:hypothetical protein